MDGVERAAHHADPAWGSRHGQHVLMPWYGTGLLGRRP
jgi:hypothetical protein